LLLVKVKYYLRLPINVVILLLLSPRLITLLNYLSLYSLYSRLVPLGSTILLRIIYSVNYSIILLLVIPGKTIVGLYS